MLEPSSSTSPHPSDPSGYNQGYFNGWQELMPMLTQFFSQTAGNPTEYPSSFLVPYGGSVLDAYRERDLRERTHPSYSFSYDRDRTAQGANIAQIVNKTIATLGINVSEEMRDTIHKAAETLAQWGPQALNIAEQIIGQEGGDNKMATTVVGALQKALDATYGPVGSTMPFYLRARQQANDVIPLDMQDSFLQAYMHDLFAIDKRTSRTGGYTASDLSRILQYSIQQGGNPLTYNDTAIARETAEQLLNVGNVSEDQLKNMAAENREQNLMPILEKNNVNSALNQWVHGGVDPNDVKRRQQAITNLNKGFELQGQINQLAPQIADATLKQQIRDFSAETATVDDWTNLQQNLTTLANNTTGNTALRDKYTNLAEQASKQAEALKNNGYSSAKLLSDAQAIQRQNVRQAVADSGFFSKDEDINDYTEGLLLQDQLSTFGLNVQDLTSTVSDSEGNDVLNSDGTKKQRWQQLLEENKLNAQAATVVRNYFQKGVYQKQRDLDAQIENQLTEADRAFIAEYKTKSPAEKAEMAKTPQGQRVLNYLQASSLAAQSGKATTNLGEAVSQIGTALQATGSQIQDPTEQARFLDMITQGGFTNMTDTRLRDVASKVSAGMLSSQATDQQVAQMSAAGHKAAAAAGADVRNGGVSGVLMGLAATSVARKNGHMNVEMAQQIAAEAAGSANRSIVTQSINAIDSWLQGTEIDENNPYAQLLHKIQNKENLTSEELDLLEAQGQEIMSSLGMNSQEIHDYMHRIYSGEGNDYAVAHGTAQLLNSRIIKQSTAEGASRSLSGSGLLEGLDEDSQKDLITAITGSLSDVDTNVITESKRAEEYQKAVVSRLRKEGKNDLADKVEKMTPHQAQALQTAANRALRSGADATTNGDIEQFSMMQRLSNNILSEYSQNNLNAAIADAMPKTDKGVAQGMITALTTGNIGDVMRAMSTAFSDANLTDEQKEAAFNLIGLQSIVDERFLKSTGLNEKETESAKNTLFALYQAAGGDKEGMQLINRVLSGQGTDEDNARYAEIVNKAKNEFGLETKDFANADNTGLLDIVDKAATNVKEKYEKSNLSRLNRPADAPQEPPVAPADNPAPVTPTDNPAPVTPTGTPATPNPSDTADATPRAGASTLPNGTETAPFHVILQDA